MTLYSHLVVFFFTGFMALTAELAPAAVYLHQTVNSHSHYRSGWKHESTFSSVSNKTCTINSLKTPAASKTKVCAAGFHRGKENDSRKPLNGKTIGLSDKCKKDSDYSPLLFQLLETINDGAVWSLDESTHLPFHIPECVLTRDKSSRLSSHWLTDSYQLLLLLCVWKLNEQLK